MIAAIVITTSRPSLTSATGEAVCAPSDSGFAGHAISVVGLWDRGARATIEGQAFPLCTFAGTFYPSGSFHWSAIGYADPAWAWQGEILNIVQIGHGRCLNANNNLGLGTLCNGNYYWYWAWGSYCGSGTPQGTYLGPVPIRIGAALSAPPPTKDVYVLRRLVNGVARYEGFVDGQLLTGLSAAGQTVSASVLASSLCWDHADTDTFRVLDYFGETFNYGDSMGGWIGAVRNHLDFTQVRYSVNTGWLSPNWSFPGPFGSQTLPISKCTKSGSDRMYIDTR